MGECQANMACLSQACEQLGVPLALHKYEGPSTCLKFLEIEIDSVSMEFWLPADKVQRKSGMAEGGSSGMVEGGSSEMARKNTQVARTSTHWLGCFSMRPQW